MKIRDAIRLLQQQDPEAELRVLNHEFQVHTSAEMLIQDTRSGAFYFRDDVEYIPYLRDGEYPTEVNEEMLAHQREHIAYLKRCAHAQWAARELVTAEQRLAALESIAAPEAEE